ncbi:protein MAIN-LIKE 2 [Argentina anserina]|uniref:protein MAIN-LIKE 2 n=1 Tax=Argentina anserina TaxID=57926 RepID=UPI0021768C5A|nr:protein MAIN-LIKE 2 [Potentilla anserina]XP_050380094.1 protein MAIN-LIKE 2 [Potentilla anserina]XP_050380095.1 protein MAIN-LIKE 2 [Potentilla anserina]
MEELSIADPYGTNPGPIDGSVLYDQEKHVSSAVWDGQERGALRCHEHTSKLDQWTLTETQLELVEKAGFGYLRLIPAISLDNPLISALVERWRKETNTFHLNVGEMTVTLKDVAFLLGLSIDGDPVMGVTYTTCNSVCERFLGKTPESNYVSGGMVKLSWLKDTYSLCPEDAPLEVIKYHTRAYLLYLVGSTIFSTTTGNKVPVMYLPLFEDFDQCGKYAWGAGALAFLYRALGNASQRSQSTISGCLTLLQCWSYFYLKIGRPKLSQDLNHSRFPLVLSWKGKQSGPTTNRDVVFYRKVLDSLKECDVEWLPYKHLDSRVIPKKILNDLRIAKSKTMLICFDKAERHLPDRCQRQFGDPQPIPEDVERWERKSRGVDGGVDLSTKLESELNEWSERRFHIVERDDDADESEYMQWYLKITRKFVGRPISLSSEFQRTNAGLRDIAHIADTFSTRGLDPEQADLILRIRDIAHECLRDQIGCPATASPTSQNELGKRIRGKERVRRRGAGKRLRKDHPLHYHTASEDDRSPFSGATVVVDRLQSYHAHREEDHLPLYTVQNEVNALHMINGDVDIGFDQSELVQVTGEECNSELNHAVVKVDETHLFEATETINDSQICNAMNEVKDIQISDSTKVDSHICNARNVIDSQLSDAPEGVTNSQICNADEEVDVSHVIDATQEVTDSCLSATSVKIDDPELPEPNTGSEGRTTKLETEIPECSPEGSQDIANQSSVVL